MTSLNLSFIHGLVDSLNSDFAQKKMGLALESPAQLSRVFDEYRPSKATSVAMYNDMIKVLGQEALSLELEDENGQAALSIKLTKEMDLLTEKIAKELLTPHQLSLKQTVKMAMGGSYDRLRRVMSEEKLINLLIQAALVSYAQALTDGCLTKQGITASKFGAENATHEQLDLMQHFAQNIGRKMGQFALAVNVSYIKLTSLNHQLTDAIRHLNQYKKGFFSLYASTKEREKRDELTDAVTALSHFKEQLSADLHTLNTNHDYSMAKTLASEKATVLAQIIQEKILDKPNLAQLHGFFEHLLNILIITFTLGYKSYIAPAKQAVEPLNDFIPPSKPNL